MSTRFENMNSDNILARRPLITRSRVYAEIFEHTPTSYFEHETYAPAIENIEDYSLIRKIGQGKFSLVFEGSNDLKRERVIIKILKPIKKFKINREIKILEILRNGANIINLVAVVNIPNTRQSALIFAANANNRDFKELYLTWPDYDIRHYTFEVLKALDYCHSHGIMHRDVKPHNIIVNTQRRRIQLIDFGLAEFYRSGERYNVRVASRHYKGPELLVEYGYYDYSLDIWSLGCVFAAMIFRKEPFFQGINNDNQLLCIVKVLGSAQLFAYLKKYNITIEEKLENNLRDKPTKSWQKFIASENEHLISVEGINLLESFLRTDHMERISAKEAMEHPYFSHLKRYKTH